MDPVAVAASPRLAQLARTSFGTTLLSALLSLSLLAAQVDIFLLHRPPAQPAGGLALALKLAAGVSAALSVLATIVGLLLRRLNARLAQATKTRERLPSGVGAVAGQLQGAPEQIARLRAGLGCSFPITVGVLGLSLVVATITYTPAQQIAVALNNPLAPGAPGVQANATPKLPSGTVKEFPIPTPLSAPRGITAGPDGNLWFVESKGNKVGKITRSGVITEYPIPTADADPLDITKGPDGNLWFIEGQGYKIGHITPSGAITEFPVPADSGSLGLIDEREITVR